MAKRDRGPGKRYPVALRRRAAALARREVAARRGLRGLARRLSLHPKTLKTWIEDAELARTPAVVPVEVVAPAAPATGAVTLVSPSGYRLEGLTLDDAIQALARLR